VLSCGIASAIAAWLQKFPAGRDEPAAAAFATRIKRQKTILGNLTIPVFLRTNLLLELIGTWEHANTKLPPFAALPTARRAQSKIFT
jgi:hypothetical protein